MLRALDDTVDEGPKSESARASSRARSFAAIRASSSNAGLVSLETARTSAALAAKTPSPIAGVAHARRRRTESEGAIMKLGRGPGARRAPRGDRILLRDRPDWNTLPRIHFPQPKTSPS